MRTWVFCFLMILSASTAWAQESGVIAGRIVDAEGQPLPGANVVVSGSALSRTRGMTTDAQGAYRIEGLPAGSYIVTASYVGYKAKTAMAVAVRTGTETLQHFELEAEAILQGQIVVSASRKQEKALNAPASVAVVETAEIQNRTATSVADFVKTLPGVDYAQTGMSQNNTVVRGFNNIFSGALLMLVDNRISGVPSLRFNSNNFISITDDDIERVEVVLGPGSALYGPNSANGVMHIITRSPLVSTGTALSATGGERSLRKVSLRHAGRLNNKFGYKFSGQYYAATDWKYEDPEEVRLRGFNPRDYNQERKLGELRLDFRPTDDLTAIVSAGYTDADNIDMTGLGGAQAQGWKYQFIQGRLLYNGWFAQVFHNKSDAGKTRLLQSGNPIVDKSTLSVIQIQHAAALGERQQFTYGLDALYTRPNTEGTITGSNENKDDVNEYGFYLQSDTQFSEQLSLVLAGRIDDHNHVENPVFSPRAALVFKPADSHTLRFTYNRAFETPTSNNLFLDLLASPDAFGLGKNFATALGFNPAVNVRTQGTTTGFGFRRDAGGLPQFRSSFAPVAGKQKSDYISLNDPLFTNAMWGVARGAVLAQLVPQLRQTATGLIAQQLIAAGVPASQAQIQATAQAEQLAAVFPNVIPQTLSGLQNAVGYLNQQTRGFDFVSTLQNAVNDVPQNKPTITETFEVGYKSIVNNKLLIAMDVYRSERKDFSSPLRIETPNVFLSPTSISAAFAPALTQNLANPNYAALASAVKALDAPTLGGNGNGSAIDELTTLFTKTAASIPFGTITPEEAVDPTAVMLTYRNFGKVTYYGADVSLAFYPTPAWTISGNYSYVSEDLFKNLDGIADIALNAPKHKANLSAQYTFPQMGLKLEGRMRYRGAFPMNSGVYVGPVEEATVVDFHAAYDLPLSGATQVVLHVDASNVLNKKYQAFVGAPEIGRLVTGGVTVRF